MKLTADDVIRSVRQRQSEFHEAERFYWTDYDRVSVDGSLPRGHDGPSSYLTMGGTRGGMMVASVDPGWTERVMELMERKRDGEG